MEEELQEENTGEEFIIKQIDQELTNFSFLIETIVYYYKAQAENGTEYLEGDEWKKGTKYDNLKEFIPDRVNNTIEEVFITRLKKYIK